MFPTLLGIVWELLMTGKKHWHLAKVKYRSEVDAVFKSIAFPHI